LNLNKNSLFPALLLDYKLQTTNYKLPMYHLYTTQAFILKSYPSGDANCLYLLFTKDFGLIRASAQGVRFLKSKLRHRLQEFNFLEVTLVRGKEYWRITNAGEEQNLFLDFKKQPAVLKILARVFNLLKRLLHGEEKNETLFAHLEETCRYFQSREVSLVEAVNVEYILVLRILHSLGYIGSSPDTLGFVETPFWTAELINQMSDFKNKALETINQSLLETQL